MSYPAVHLALTWLYPLLYLLSYPDTLPRCPPLLFTCCSTLSYPFALPDVLPVALPWS